MENDLFVDTNILIHLLNGNVGLLPILENKVIHVSFVTEMEMLSKNNISRIEMKNVQLLFDECKMYDFNDKIKTAAIILMRNYRLKLADAIIAATTKLLRFNFINRR
jgi:predicted nucleic acid-binding protein